MLFKAAFTNLTSPNWEDPQLLPKWCQESEMATKTRFPFTIVMKNSVRSPIRAHQCEKNTPFLFFLFSVSWGRMLNLVQRASGIWAGKREILGIPALQAMVLMSDHPIERRGQRCLYFCWQHCQTLKKASETTSTRNKISQTGSYRNPGKLSSTYQIKIQT